MKPMKDSVDQLKIIRSGTTMRDPEVWKLDLENTKVRDLERSIGTLNLATVTFAGASTTVGTQVTLEWGLAWIVQTLSKTMPALA